MAAPLEPVASLAGTVKLYHRHVFACTGGTDWPPRLEEADGLLGRMAREVLARREGPAPVPKLTATDEPSEGEGLDLLVFPEAVRCRGVDAESWPRVLADPLVGGRRLHGIHIFVCVHGARDARCGECGPPLRAALEGAAASHEDVAVRATSHVGGHKYAGNVLVYPAGVWYGHATPEDAPRIIAHARAGRIVEELYRGSMQPA